jgi:hypothetical protein
MTYDSIETLPPLPPIVEAMLEHERALVDKPALLRARLMARARESVHCPDSLAFSRVAPSALRPLWLAVAAGIMLVAIVAAAVQLFRTSEFAKPSPSVALPPPAVVVVPTLNPTPALSATQAPDTVSHASGKADVVEELRILDRARRADSRGEYATALALVAEHERRFPHGRLAEDREVLRMRAFVGLDRGSDAHATAAKFRRQFPRSVLLSKIDALLARLH